MHAERTTTPDCTMSAQPLHSRLTSKGGRAGAKRRLPCVKVPKGTWYIHEENCQAKIAMRKSAQGTWYIHEENCEGEVPPTNHVDGCAQGAMRGARST